MVKIEEAIYDINAHNFNELIKKISLILIDKGYVKESFTKNILSREKKYPTGLSFENFNVAIPHTDPVHVIKNGIIAIKTKYPIEMIHMATTNNKIKVSYFFVLLVNEGKMQINLLTELMTKFANSNFQDKLKEIKNALDLQKVFLG